MAKLVLVESLHQLRAIWGDAKTGMTAESSSPENVCTEPVKCLGKYQ
jgi:hypothetical protein